MNRELYRKSSVCRAKENTHFSHEQLLCTDTGENSNANLTADTDTDRSILYLADCASDI